MPTHLSNVDLLVDCQETSMVNVHGSVTQIEFVLDVISACGPILAVTPIAECPQDTDCRVANVVVHGHLDCDRFDATYCAFIAACN